MFFHTHCYNPIPNDPEMLYCRCGSTKDIHRHVWENIETIDMIVEEQRTFPVGYVMQCKICGERKDYYIRQYKGE